MLSALRNHAASERRNDTAWVRPRWPLPAYKSNLADPAKAREREKPHPFAFMILDITYGEVENRNSAHAISQISAAKHPLVTEVLIMGVGEGGETHALHVHGFMPSFDCDSGVLVRCPQSDHAFWCKRVKQKLNRHMAVRRKKDGPTPTAKVFRVSVVMRKPLYTHYVETVPFFHIELLSPGDVPQARRLIWKEGVLRDVEWGACYRTYESNIEFVVRNMIDTNITGCGWVDLDVAHRTILGQICVPDGAINVRKHIDPRFRALVEKSKDACTSACDVEIDVHWTRIVPLDPEKNPRWSRIAPMVIMSYDIEVKAARRGEFPVPEKKGCQIIDIGNLITVYGADKRHKLVTFCLGRAAKPDTPQRDPDKGEMAVPEPQVLCYDTEADMMMAWAKMNRGLNVDITTGYNIYGFDGDYMYSRAAHLGIQRDFAQMTSKLPLRTVKLREAGFANKARGAKKFRIPATVGNVQFDCLYAVDGDFFLKVRSKKLDNVAGKVLGRYKIDVHHTEINALHETSDETRKRLVEYVNEDAILPMEIIETRAYIPAFVELARVCHVPLQWMLTKGQQVKVVGTLLPFTKADAWAMPYIKREWLDDEEVARGAQADEGYQGATVLDPVTGFYSECVVVLDFASLYPSIMQWQNLCYSTLLAPGSALRSQLIEGVHYNVGATGHAFLRKQFFLGVIPHALEVLLKARSAAKRAAAEAKEKHGKNSSEYKREDARQGALKIMANSIYGFTGATVGRLPCPPIAETVTAYGRKLIEQTKEMIESLDDTYRVVYGDSVSGDTPVLVHGARSGRARFVRIDALCSDGAFERQDDGKECAALECGPRVWTDSGWTRVRRVIRHAVPAAEMWRVCTPTGAVDVTRDHSLLWPDGIKAHVDELRAGRSALLHRSPSRNLHIAPPEFTVRDAHALGVAWAQSMIASTSADPTGVPGAILCAPLLWVDAFFRAVWILRGVMQDKETYVLHCRGKSATAGLFLLAERLGWHASIRSKKKARNAFRILLTTVSPGAAEDTVVCEVREWTGEERFAGVDGDSTKGTLMVYDLETDNHHFHVGPGNLVVHNTDSVMVHIVGCKSVARAITLGKQMEKYCNERFERPIQLELENVYYPWLLQGKKMYSGPFWESETGPTYIKSRGLTNVRRDNALFASELFNDMVETLFAWDAKANRGNGGLIEAVRDPETGRVVKHGWNLSTMRMEGDNITPAIELIHQRRAALYTEGIPLEKLVISQAFSRPLEKYKTKLPHTGLIERMRKRDAASAPQMGDRVPYVVLKSHKDAKLYERTEDPRFAKEHNLPLDLKYYDETQCQKPIIRFMAPIFASKLGVKYVAPQLDQDEIPEEDRDDWDAPGKSWLDQLKETEPDATKEQVKTYKDTILKMMSRDNRVPDPHAVALRVLFPMIRKRIKRGPGQHSPFYAFRRDTPEAQDTQWEDLCRAPLERSPAAIKRARKWYFETTAARENRLATSPRSAVLQAKRSANRGDSSLPPKPAKRRKPADSLQSTFDSLLSMYKDLLKQSRVE